MPIQTILDLLKLEREKISAAIAALEGGTTPRKPGRPRKDPLADAPEWVKPPRKKRTFTAAQKLEQSKRAKAMWKKRKAAARKST